jgi:hypothetical protein
MISQKEYLLSSARLWYSIEEHFGTSGGVYVLYCKKDAIKTVNRLLGTDENGVLYIGMAKSFLDRTIELKKSISPDYISANHECGTRFKSNERIREKYPYKDLRVKLIASDEPRVLEQQLLTGYILEFGELPPLNRVG